MCPASSRPCACEGGLSHEDGLEEKRPERTNEHRNRDEVRRRLWQRTKEMMRARSAERRRYRRTRCTVRIDSGCATVTGTGTLSMPIRASGNSPAPTGRRHDRISPNSRNYFNKPLATRASSRHESIPAGGNRVECTVTGTERGVLLRENAPALQSHNGNPCRKCQESADKKLVVEAALRNFQGAILDAINETVFVGDTTRPPARKFMFQRFRFACAFVWSSGCFMEQRIKFF